MPTIRNLWVVLTMLLMAACTVPVIPAAPAPDAWRTFRSDSGYEISYPVGAYSMRTGLSRADVLFPGLKVVEPNDAFFYQAPRSATYKLSIAVTENVNNWTLDDAESLLSNSAIVDYDPEMLAGKTIQQTTLGGEPALRVDDLPSGPTGITSQIVAIHGPFIYELMVEPHQLTGNQAEPFVEPAPSASNRALMDEIIATFRFVGDETLVEPAPISSTPATPTAPTEDEPHAGLALVETVDVLILESFPVQVNAVVHGYLADACTELGEIEQQFDGATFMIELTTVRDPNLMCAQVLTPFEQTIPLDVAGLAAGTYTVTVNGVTAQFELAMDNVPLEEMPTGGAAETSVAYVMAQVDAPMYGGTPGDTSNQIGFVAGGQIALVTGISPDGAWWRVICPDDTVGDCWVSADPAVTQPTTPP